MKKIIVPLILAFIFCSCKKDHVCECTSSPYNTTGKATIKGVSKKTAKDICISSSYVFEDYTTSPPQKITVNENCTLK